METDRWLGAETPHVCVVSHLLDVLPLTPFVMRSYELGSAARARSEDGRLPLGDWRMSILEAGRATSAAPTYFEPYTLWRTWESPISMAEGDEEQQAFMTGQRGHSKRGGQANGPAKQSRSSVLGGEISRAKSEARGEVEEEEDRHSAALTVTPRRQDVESDWNATPTLGLLASPAAAGGATRGDDGGSGSQACLTTALSIPVPKSEPDQPVSPRDEETTLTGFETLTSSSRRDSGTGSHSGGGSESVTKGGGAQQRKVIDLKVPDAEELAVLRSRLSRETSRSTLVHFQNRSVDKMAIIVVVA